MLKNLIIENFRGIKKLKIEDFRQVNLIVGKNNSGKTTLLEALFLITNPENPHLPASVINSFRNLNLIDENSWPILFNRLNINNNIRFSGELSENNEKRELLIKPDSENISTEISVTEEGTGLKNPYTGIKPLINNLILEYSFKKGKSRKTETFISIATRTKDGLIYTRGKLHKEILPGVLVKTEDIYKTLSTTLNNIIIKKGMGNIIGVLRKIEPSVESISLGANGIVYCDTGLDRMVPINVLGNGITSLLSVISIISDNPGGVILMDEIENGLHYSSQKILWEAIFKSAKEFNTQVFATTHSIECIKAFSDACDLPDDNIRLYRIERKGDEFKTISYDNKVIKASLDKEWEVR